MHTGLYQLMVSCIPESRSQCSASSHPLQATGTLIPDMKPNDFFHRRFFLPSEHGSWIWWIGPFVLGAAAADRWTSDLITLFMAMMATFLLRQPLTILVKTLSSRRAKSDRLPASLWVGIYSLIAIRSFASLLAAGFGQLAVLLIPGVPVFIWQLFLVSRRAERGQRGIEIVGAGVLALAAPASYWIASGQSSSLAWALWAIAWLQSAASIVLVYQRLQERNLDAPGDLSERLKRAGRSLAYHSFNLSFILLLWTQIELPWMVPLASALMLLDAADSLRAPAVRWKPTRIGLRQLFASGLFMLLVSLGFLL
ncbi:MAG: hypothetical protein E4G99_10060 [Anaerolineales bacterium]|nr:MAG: hypothetical protein E4G99_10060 [Anaerolineales bacterium]